MPKLIKPPKLNRKERTPFLYAVGWPELDAYYVGVRFANGCDPSDLWSIYFTSSWLVQGLAYQFGAPPYREIMGTYTSPEAALAAEKDAIKSFDLVGHRSFLNQWAGHGEMLTPEQLVQRGKAISAQARTPGASERRSAANHRKFANPAMRELLSERAYDCWADDGIREKRLEGIRQAMLRPEVSEARAKGIAASWTPERHQRHRRDCQQRGAKKAYRYDCGGEMLTVNEMAERSGVKADALKWRMGRGMAPLEAMTPGRLPKGTT